MEEDKQSQHSLHVTVVGSTGRRRLVDRPIGADGVMVSVQAATDLAKQLAEHDFQILVSDFKADGGTGSVRVLRGTAGGEEVVVVGEGDPNGLEDTALLGAVTRPLSPDVLQSARDGANGTEVQPFTTVGRDGNGLIAESPAIQELLSKISRIASSSASVMLNGETGVGKSIFARAIHDSSIRREQPFVVVNCSALQETLLESELFGHEKGAFTGAVVRKNGLLEIADGGTLFLDEIGDMGSAMQAKLLTVLDTGEFRRVGGTKTERVNVRFVAATNKSLDEEVKDRRFREDLLFRLAVITLTIPPIRERQEDLKALINSFLARHGGAGRTLSSAGLCALCAYSWPGNVRELANTIEGLCLMAPGQEIMVDDLPPKFLGPAQTDEPASPASPGGSDWSEGSPPSMSDVEKIHIERILGHTKGKKAPAARILGVDVKTLSSKIEKYQIKL